MSHTKLFIVNKVHCKTDSCSWCQDWCAVLSLITIISHKTLLHRHISSKRLSSNMLLANTKCSIVSTAWHQGRCWEIYLWIESKKYEASNSAVWKDHAWFMSREINVTFQFNIAKNKLTQKLFHLAPAKHTVHIESKSKSCVIYHFLKWALEGLCQTICYHF